MDSHGMEEGERDSISIDVEGLWTHLKVKNAELQRKREWLMGKHRSSSFMDKEMRSERPVPESMLREDDLFFDIAKGCVYQCLEECSGDGLGSAIHCDDDEAVGRSTSLNTILATLDNLTNSGLYLLAKFIMGSDAPFETTRLEIKKIVKAYLSRTHGDQRHGVSEDKILRYLRQLVKDPHNFYKSPTTDASPSLQSHRAAVYKILEKLEHMPSHTLAAMLRKLTDEGLEEGNGKRKMHQIRKGVNGDGSPSSAGKSEYVTQVKTCKWRKQRLISYVKESCLKMLSHISDSDELPMPLMKAMAIVGLSSMVYSHLQDLSYARFRNFPPEIEALQREIVMAVRLLENTEKPELMKLKALFDPLAELPDRGLKAALKNVLIDFIFDCGDMDVIPNSLYDALSVINRDSRGLPRGDRFFSSAALEEDMESIFCVSAEMKQILWDCLPDCEVGEDFANAYMEELEESDDEDFFDDGFQGLDTSDGNGIWMNFKGYMEEEENSGDPVRFNLPATADRENTRNMHQALTMSPSNDVGGELEPEHATSMDLVVFEQPDDKYSNITCSKMELTCDIQITYRNRYLAIQEVCDDASLVAYQAVGHILEGFAETEKVGFSSEVWLYLGGSKLNLKNQKDLKEEFMEKAEERRFKLP